MIRSELLLTVLTISKYSESLPSLKKHLGGNKWVLACLKDWAVILEFDFMVHPIISYETHFPPRCGNMLGSGFMPD